ncbi:MAG: hypothetical protein IJV40_11515 [Oscillospiraceae bacterium]|nr:hypothetical protein [Oscillospiraceae bacterium]
MSINPSELIWTVINFFLLLFLLKHFLYTPVLRFMEDRQARMDAKLNEEKQAQDKVEENDARLQSQKAKSREEAKRILAQSGDELEKRHAEAMSQARAASSQVLKDGEAALSEQREKTAEALRTATPELAELLAKRLLNEE